MPSIGQWTDKCVKPETDLVRSGPIYVDTPNGIVTLVKEGYALSGSATDVQPIAAYIIDDKGVRRISIPPSLRKRRLLTLALLVLAGIAFWLFRSR